MYVPSTQPPNLICEICGYRKPLFGAPSFEAWRSSKTCWTLSDEGKLFVVAREKRLCTRDGMISAHLTPRARKVNNIDGHLAVSVHADFSIFGSPLPPLFSYDKQ